MSETTLHDTQPKPTPNDHSASWDLVIADMKARDNFGAKKYGTRLQPFNGRDQMRDAYEEALDMCVYLKQSIIERDARRREQDMVREFHEAFGVGVAESPSMPSEEISDLRAELIAEEFEELLDAIEGECLSEIAKEMADLVYVIYGTALAYGIDLHAVFAEVHRSNMSKRCADGSILIREDGKILKPETYSPADVKGVLGI